MNGSLLTDNTAFLTRLAVYCQELYNYESKSDTTSSVEETEDMEVVKEEVEEALPTLK